MEPARPPVSRSSSSQRSFYQDASDDRPGEQAGRSTTNLNAQLSAQSLREARRSRPGIQGPSKSASSPNLLRKKNKSQAAMGAEASPRVGLIPPGSSSSIRRPSPHAPAVSSPLNPILTNGSSSSHGSDGRKTSEETGESSSHTSSDNNASAIGMAVPFAGSDNQSTPIPRLHSARPLEMGQRDSSASLSRLSTPRTVRDLGQDYTRYFNPFVSRNNSQNDLTTPLPRYNSQTHLLPSSAISGTDLEKRLSDPFQDTKRLSNPFESKPSSTPGTPNQQAASQGLAAAAAADVSSTPAFINDADPEKSFYPYMDDRLAAPAIDMPLYNDEKEDDDDMHMPMWDDDIRLKPKWRDHFSRDNIRSTAGLIFVVLGLLCIFVVLPVISFTGTDLLSSLNTPGYTGGSYSPAQSWATVNDRAYPLMKNMRTGLIDPDTPASAQTRTSVTGETLNLVFSDEFNELNRSFYPGDDPYWYGFDGWYGATQDLEWYDPDAINTGDGTLQIQLDAFRSHNLNYRSGMLHSWNQLCFKGGVYEVSLSLPGPGGVHGYWPGAWTMGNLGRPGYLSTTDGMWPYTYNECDAGITPNQSMTDGTSNLPGQRLSSCTCPGEDHPTPGTGRGAPEIDILEASGDWGGEGIGVATQSFQVAPFDIWWYPNYDFMETPNYETSFVNTYTGGPYQQAVSTTTMLNNSWYDGIEYQKYAYEYAPGNDENAYIAWYVGDQITMRFDGRALGPNGNIGQRVVSEEPMSMIINLGFSNSWVDIDWAALKFPTVMRIDYVRWYQVEGQEMVTCDPPGYETTQYIADHAPAYNNPNFTHWSDVGYDWPTNSFMHGC